MCRTRKGPPGTIKIRSSFFLAGFLGALLLAPGPAGACPDIDGLTDLNCDRVLQIVCFGDSITRGVRDSTGLGYPGRLGFLLPHARIINVGVPGETSARGASRASRTFQTYPGTDYVVVLEGVNDYFQDDRSSSRTRNNVLSIVRSARNTGATALLANLTDIRRDYQKSWVRSVNSAIAPYRQIDFYSLGTDIISSDLLHPNGSGYQRMAELARAILAGVSATNKPPDSDADGIYDFAEPRFGSSPFVADTDGDGLTDGSEVFQYGSSPVAIDTDADGYPDRQEVQEIGSDPADPKPGAPQLESLQVIN